MSSPRNTRTRPAFPKGRATSDSSGRAASLVEYASIQTDVSYSGIPWLDAAIEQSNWQKDARAAMQSLRAMPVHAGKTAAQIAVLASEQADAMAAERATKLLELPTD